MWILKFRLDHNRSRGRIHYAKILVSKILNDMKNIKYCIVILGMILAVGCGDFLDEYSQDEIIPSTDDYLDQLLVG